MDWSGINVLVTGGAGFIGSHLVEELLARRARVTAFVRYTSRASTGFLSSLTSEVPVVAGNLTEYESVYRAMKDREYVFHLGALIGVPYSFVHPREVVHVNTIGSLHVLTAARETKPGRVLGRKRGIGRRGVNIGDNPGSRRIDGGGQSLTKA